MVFLSLGSLWFAFQIAGCVFSVKLHYDRKRAQKQMEEKLIELRFGRIGASGTGLTSEARKVN